jgi:hypothetical protein
MIDYDRERDRLQVRDVMENEAQRLKQAIRYGVRRKSRYGRPGGNQKPWNAEGPMTCYLCDSVRKTLALAQKAG